MRFFSVTADLAEITELAALGLLDGLAIGPAMVSRPGPGSYQALIASLAAVVSGPVCASVTTTDHDAMMLEGMALAKLAANIAITVPPTPAGLKTCRTLRDTGTLCAITFCFTPAQALLAAKAGAAFVLPFVGGLEDTGDSGIRLVGEVCDMFRNYPGLKTEVFAASLRSASQVIECARIGAHGALVPPRIMHQLHQHPLTDKAVAQGAADVRKAG